ncbi:hypothetical protein AB0C47_21670 [Micromonospora taraxaci]|uniref:hypothetical protein n=1 Tax=Micromonospora taraxaci TaxID=1316803 RepID=UPI0033C4467A
MPDLIVALQRRIDANALRAVNAYRREVPEYASPSATSADDEVRIGSRWRRSGRRSARTPH